MGRKEVKKTEKVINDNNKTNASADKKLREAIASTKKDTKDNK